MSKVDVLLGLQWGDEGKGKVVDFLAPHYDVVARFQGGPNAGHTLEFEGKKHVLHQIPSGIFREGIVNIIGNGVVLDPVVFSKEVDNLLPFGIEARQSVVLSNKAQVILPTHKLVDQALEQQKGDSKIGSTLRGIGPTYQDKIGRHGIRVGDLLQKDFDQKYRDLKKKHFELLNNLNFDYDENALDNDFQAGLDLMRSFKIVNTEYLINEFITKDRKVLAEGAQGTLLDIDFGSYPYVTSSNTTTAGACTGLGIAPAQINRVFGIFKAYCTRVGEGPFPTELFGKAGEDLRTQGGEFGATTGRPRRCGWLDLAALQYSCMINGVSELFMMKADVLSGFDEVYTCEGYQKGNDSIDEFPFEYTQEYETRLKKHKGWNLDDPQGFESLPSSLTDYVSHIEEFTEREVSLVSLGPDREETLAKKDFY